MIFKCDKEGAGINVHWSVLPTFEMSNPRTKSESQDMDEG